MSHSLLTRRHLLKSLGVLGVAVPLLQACGGSSTSSGASSSGTTSGSSGSSSSGGASAQPTSASSSASSSSGATPKSQVGTSSGPISLSIGTYAGTADEWQRAAAKTWADKNPNVKLKVDQIVYADAPKKQLAMLATGTMEDVVFSGIKWFPYSVAKGAFREIDDYVKADDPGMDDFFSAALAGSSFEGKLYGLPYLMHPGNNALIVFNKDVIQQKGATDPTDDWSVDDYVKLATTTTDVKNKLWGTNYFPNTYYDFCSLARTWGGDDVSKDGKKFTFNTDPKSVQAAQWAVDLRAKDKIAPGRAESANLSTMFPAGQIALSTAGTYSVLGLGKTVGDKFKWDAVLFPKGPTGIRGYQGFVECFSIFSKSKQPETAFNLITAETSKDTGIMAVVKYNYQPSGRKSVWAAPEIAQISSIFGRALKWMESTPGPFPTPYNLRFSELEDKWENTSKPLFYGEVSFKQGMQQVQQACEAIMEEPRA